MADDPPDHDDQSELTDKWNEYYRDIVSILFAVVLAQSLPLYGKLLTPSKIMFDLTNVLALVTVHVAITLSWVGYHDQLARQRYRPSRRIGKTRLMLDLLIVLFYSLLISSIRWNIQYPNEQISVPSIGYTPIEIFLGLFALIYILYVLNDLTVRYDRSYPNDLLIYYNVASIGVFGLVFYFHQNIGGFISDTFATVGIGIRPSTSIVAVALIIVIIYRLCTFRFADPQVNND